MAVKLLKLTANRIAALSGNQQIAESVELVTKSIKEYNKPRDIIVLEKLRDICIKEKMMIEMAKMYRNIGMHHFYANNLNEAAISMQLSVGLLKHENDLNLLMEYYSELGLIYYYNHEYIYSKRYYEEAEELLAKVKDPDRHLIYLHYSRFGALLSNMHDYARSMEMFEKALTYAEDDKDTGMVVMNIGLLFKRQKDMKTALKHYSKALCLLDGGDMKTKSIVYNNIAEVYKILGQYDKALSYIDKAFKCITDNDMSRLFVYFNTYTEIKVLMGDRESVLDEFLSLLVRVEDFHLCKGLVIEGISNMIAIGSEDEGILKRLESVIIKLIRGKACNNEEYIKELKVCLGNIRLCLKELDN